MRVRESAKKVISVLLLVSMFVSGTGCGTKEKKAEAATLKEDLYTDYSKLNDKKIKFEADPKLINSVKQFANASTKEILKDSQENISYSPMSLYFALAVLTEGSDKDTAKELFQTLGLSDVDYDYLAKNVDELYRYLYCDMDRKVCKIANAVWMDNNFDFLPSYGDAVSNLYHSSVFAVDMHGEKTAKKMEDWVEKQLNGVMRPEIKLSSRQVMTIMNTIYYVGCWTDKFYENQTKEDTFYVTKDNTVTCDFMNRERIEDSYVDGDGYKVYEIPMEGGDSMIFCLPDEEINVSDLIASCNSIDDLFDMKNRKAADVILSIPKFDYECKLDLVNSLNCLGITKAFDPESADFSRMSKKRLNLSNATQQVHITVDEKGVVGAAYTQLEVECAAACEPEKLEQVELIYNRPFLYQIVSSNKIPIFTGIVYDPITK